MDLVVEGLTPTQVDLANQLWKMDTQEEIDEFISQLPKRARIQAITVKEMMIAACVDQAIREEPDLQLAADTLRRYMRDPSC